MEASLGTYSRRRPFDEDRLDRAKSPTFAHVAKGYSIWSDSQDESEDVDAVTG